MEEDIEILKAFIEKCEKEIKTRNLCKVYGLKVGDFRMCFDEAVVQTIENILNRLEQDERIIKEMAECFFRYKSHFTTLDEYNNENQIIDHFRKRVDNIE